MPLLTKELRAKLPPLYKASETVALVKFFVPDSDRIWYASEFDGKDTFFGLITDYRR